MRKALPWVVAVVVGYVLVLAAALIWLTPPWSYLVVALVLFKALVFIGIMTRAAKIGQPRRPS